MRRQRSAPAALRSLERQATNGHSPPRLECRRSASSPVRLPLPRDKGQDLGPVLLSTRATVVEMSYSPKEFNRQTTDARRYHKIAGPWRAGDECQRARSPVRTNQIWGHSLACLLERVAQKTSPRYSLNSLRECVKDAAG